MMSKIVFNKCIDKGITMAFAESLTGGALTYEMVKNPGASKVVLGSVVSYQRHMKEQLLNVDPKIIDKYLVVSKEVSNEMVKGIYNHTKADLCIAITGNAGPTFQNQTHKLEAYISMLFQGEYLEYHLDFDSDDREKNIEEAVKFIYQKANEII